MTDPAIEAAQRAWCPEDGERTDFIAAVGINAAREAHEEIRELHRPMTNDELRDTWPGYVGVTRAVCAGCTDRNHFSWLDECATAKLIYTSAELAR